METKDLQKHVDQVIAEMTGLVIRNDKENAFAAEFLKKVKETQKTVTEHFEPKKREAYEPYKAILDEIKRFTDALGKAEKAVKQKMSAYRAEQERKRREAEAEARRIAEERARKEAEERLLAEAEATGDESVLDEPIEVETYTPPPEKEPEKIDGISYVSHWTFEITDVNAIPREYMMPDEKKIRGVVKAMKSYTRIPGVRVYDAGGVRVR